MLEENKDIETSHAFEISITNATVVSLLSVLKILIRTFFLVKLELRIGVSWANGRYVTSYHLALFNLTVHNIDETGAKVIIMFHTCTKHKQETENSPSTSSSLRSIFILSSFIDDRQ
ncbi:CLUMA_CG010754, isoform A [Clunio marinus]|uniref:CLUMA_CG010754, isoform A n=1 Tax=Clunio marinus TaxID=568069 RepID=A0A1J1IAX3_9DIPT|nr:CLUMA_CG010754, isoform A [Clunio marinus]